MNKILSIGRDPQSDIVISDPTDVVSRLHATLRIDGAKLMLVDQSQNGTYVNGMRMTPNEEIPVTRDDVVSFANVAELDWSLVPDYRRQTLRTVLVSTAVAAVVAVVALVAIGIWAGKGDEPAADNTAAQQPTEMTGDGEAAPKTEAPEPVTGEPDEPAATTPQPKEKADAAPKEKANEEPEEEEPADEAGEEAGDEPDNGPDSLY